jgi:MHS family proline/betaine transporter-like MFS transporter
MQIQRTAATKTGDAAKRWRAAVTGIAGNTLEFYDFGIYGFLATILARQFFAASTPYIALLQTFGAFGVGFMARPIGSLLLGRLGDTLGRRRTMVLTIVMMAGGTVGIGLIPNYQRIGVLAPLLLLVARLLQGLAAGGQWGNAAAFLAEWAGPKRRGLFGGLLLSSVSGGLLLGSAVAALFSSVLTPAHMMAWGWRIPFLLGGLLVPVGMYMRRNVEEPPLFVERKGDVVPPVVREAGFGMRLLHATCLCMPLLVASYMVTVYMPSFAQLYGHIGRSAALWANTGALILTVLLAPAVGVLSDRYGRRKPILAGSALLMLCSWPVYFAIASSVPVAYFVTLQLFLTLLVVLCNGAVPASVAETFTTSTRSVGSALANALAGVMGGFAPFVSTWLVKSTGSAVSPSWLVVIAGAAAFAAALGMQEQAGRELS